MPLTLPRPNNSAENYIDSLSRRKYGFLLSMVSILLRTTDRELKWGQKVLSTLISYKTSYCNLLHMHYKKSVKKKSEIFLLRT